MWYQIKTFFNKITNYIKVKSKYFYVYIRFKLGEIDGHAINLNPNELRGWGKTTLIIKISSKFNYPIIVDTFEQKDFTEQYSRKLMADNIIKKLPTIWVASDNMSGYGSGCKVLLDCSSRGYITATDGCFEIIGGFIQH